MIVFESCEPAIRASSSESGWTSTSIRSFSWTSGCSSTSEIPAGKLDEEGEEPLETAKRELAEEIGKQAERWEPLGSFYTSPGFTDEQVHLFLASGLSDVDERPEVHENERIDVEVRPVSDLDAILAETKDSKTLIGLYALRARLAA